MKIRNFPVGVVLLLSALLWLPACRVEDGTMNEADAYSEIYTAIEQKSTECGGRPGYYLILPTDPLEYGTRLCSLSILRIKCPFNDYPIFCLEMYDIDLPGIGP
jgi:hypothetical protein